MPFKQRTALITLINFTLILIYLSNRVRNLVQNDNFTEPKMFTTYGIVIFCAVFVSIVAIIITNFGPQIMRAINDGDQNPEFDDFEDERDDLIDLRGTRATYTVSSFGVLIAMLTFVLGQSPLIMFTVLIFAGVIAQIVGDITRLLLYQDGI